jgi:peptidoglycan/LPS O-acetylase OafA/YrhL
VDLFFVLSGFLIGGILLSNQHSPRYFTTFYVRRACRIFPLYYVVLGLFFLGAAHLQTNGAADWERWLFSDAAPTWSYVVYVQNFHMARAGFGANWLAATWSLAVEEQFYLLAPMLVWWVSPTRLPWVLITAIALAPLCRIAFQLWIDPHGIASYVLLPGRWDSLFLGVLAAWVWQQPRLAASISSALPLVRTALTAGLVALAAMIASNQNIGTWGMTIIGYTIIAMCALAVVTLAMASPGGPVQHLLKLRALVWLGTVSYGVYLLHRPVTGLFHGLLLGQPPRIRNWSDAVVTLLAWTITLALAEASARWFERPIVNAGRRWTRY